MTTELSNVPIAQNWNIQKGATWSVEYEIRNKNGLSDADLSGATASFKINTPTSPEFSGTGTISGSIITITLSKTETEALDGATLYEVELIRSGGIVDKIAAGSVTLTAELV